MRDRSLFSSVLLCKNCCLGVLIVAFILGFVYLTPFFIPFAPSSQNLTAILQPPSPGHPLGTDFYGRDLFSRMILGGKVTLTVSFCATVLALSIGTIIGLIAGYLQGWIERFLMRWVDLFLGFPRLFIILLLVSLLPHNLLTIILILGGFSWMEIARLVYAETKAILVTNYFKAALTLGLKPLRLITAHVLPNLRGVLLTAVNLLFATMLTVESSLSFLGLGVSEPDTSWGTLLSQGRLDPFGAWWLMLFPGIAIFLTALAFNLIGEGIDRFYGETQR